MSESNLKLHKKTGKEAHGDAFSACEKWSERDSTVLTRGVPRGGEEQAGFATKRHRLAIHGSLIEKGEVGRRDKVLSVGAP